MPQISGINFSSWVLCGFIFNYLIHRFHLRRWMWYNYILATALHIGTAISMIVIFFTLTLPKRGGIVLNWWGNMWVQYPAPYSNSLSDFISWQGVAEHSRCSRNAIQASTGIRIYWTHKMVLIPLAYLHDRHPFYIPPKFGPTEPIFHIISHCHLLFLFAHRCIVTPVVLYIQEYTPWFNQFQCFSQFGHSYLLNI